MQLESSFGGSVVQKKTITQSYYTGQNSNVAEVQIQRSTMDNNIAPSPEQVESVIEKYEKRRSTKNLGGSGSVQREVLITQSVQPESTFQRDYIVTKQNITNSKFISSPVIENITRSQYEIQQPPIQLESQRIQNLQEIEQRNLSSQINRQNQEVRNVYMNTVQKGSQQNFDTKSVRIQQNYQTERIDIQPPQVIGQQELKYKSYQNVRHPKVQKGQIDERAQDTEYVACNIF